MKFTTQLLTILAASTVYSFELFKRQYNVGPECQKDLDTVKEFQCINGNQITLDNYKEVCPYVLSDECTKFFEDPLSHIPNCKNENDFKALADKNSLDLVKKIINLKCSTDGDGKLCPAAEANIQGLNINEYHVKKTCKSKKCTIALNDALTALTKQSTNQSEGIYAHGATGVFGILKDLLNQSSCSSQAKDDTQSTNNNNSNANSNANSEANSGANSIYKLGSSLILSFAMALAYF